MTTSPVPVSARRLLPLLCAVFAALAGCATSEPQRAAPEQRPAAAPAPAAPAATPITGFAPALRCMDTLLLDYGVRDLTVMVDDLADQTKGNAAGAKDVLVQTVASMTQRSRAIRVIASGKEWGNTASAMASLKREQFAVVPQYALRGTLTLQDGQVMRRGNETFSTSQMGIDLALLTTQDFSVVPGVGSRNAATLFKQGRNFDGRAELTKFGVNFGLTSAGGTIAGDTSRALMELASIELFGRLARVPYWTCLGMNEAHAGVSAEIQDWYDTMAVNKIDLIKYFQSQLRLRRAYEGPIDGAPNAALKDAVSRYREALGLPAEAKLSLDFFKAYLAADHVQVAAQLAPTQVAAAAPVAPAPSVAPTPSAPAPSTATPPRPLTIPSNPAPAPVAAASPASLSLRITTSADPRNTKGQAVQLSIRPSRDAHVYCYMQDKDNQVKRFFPNRFQSDSRVLADGLKLPGAMRFEIGLPPRGVRETVACFATERDVLAQLPDTLNAGDFDALPVASLDQVKTAFARASNGALAQETIQLQAK